MLTLLILANLKLGIYLFAGVIFGSLAWLYFDALQVRKQKNIWLRAIGALLVAISYLIGAVVVENVGWSWVKTLAEVMHLIRITGYLILGIGVWSESLSERPKVGITIVSSYWSNWLLPILPGWVGLGYWRRASLGLERHLTNMAYGMYVLSLAEILDLRRIMVGVGDVRIYELVRDFGPIWILQLVVMAIGLGMVSRWVFGYLLRRFETQLSLFVCMLMIFGYVVTTSLYSYIMATQLRESVLRQVESGMTILKSGLTRLGDQVRQEAEGYVNVDVSDKEVVAKQVDQSSDKVMILDEESRDILTGEKLENRKDGVGYVSRGVGSSKRVLLSAKIKREGGYIVVEQNIAPSLDKYASEIEMAIRVFDEEKVVIDTGVPGYPRIESVLGIKKVSQVRLAGVSYIVAKDELKDAEGALVGQVELAVPEMVVWSQLSSGLMMMYGLGVVVLLLLEIPVLLIVRYLVRQL